MNAQSKRFPTREPPRRFGYLIETVIGCKWSLSILNLIERGTVRPGAIERSIEGLSAKVLGDCLKRLVELGLLSKRAFPEVPPRVEYGFTDLGARFFGALEALQSIESELQREPKLTNNIETR